MTEPSDFTNPSPDHSPRLCAQCKAVLAEDGASSLCPACLLQLGFETQNGDLGQPGDSSAAYQPTSQLFSVNGVDWLAEELSSGFRFTTVGLPVNTEVTVPDAYAPEADVIAQLSVPISRAIPQAEPPV